MNTFKEFPDWIYSPYLLNLKSLEELYSSGKNVYMPNFDNPRKFFVYVNDTKALIPTQYSDNTYFSNKWEIGYLPAYPQETWGQNIAIGIVDEIEGYNVGFVVDDPKDADKILGFIEEYNRAESYNELQDGIRQFNNDHSWKRHYEILLGGLK